MSTSNNRILCTCHVCSKNSFVHNGVTSQGLYVHPRTRRQHLSDTQNHINKELARSLTQLSLQEFPDVVQPNRQSSKSPIQKKTKSKPNPSSDPAEVEYKPIGITHVYVMYFVAWLFLYCGLSQAKCREVVTYLIYLIKKCRQLPPNVEMENKIPVDIRTITKNLKLNPVLVTYVCCQKCYSLYNLETSPLTCEFKETNGSLVCGNELFDGSRYLSLNRIPRARDDRFRPSKPKKKRNHPVNPSSIFITQSFQSWLEWLLSMPEVEHMISDDLVQPNAQPSVTNDYLESLAFKKITSLSKASPPKTSPLNLVFTLFVDWFNPLGNKMAGKQVSLGVLALTCLNLPPAWRYKTQHTYVAGLIPAPNQPDMITVNNVLRPLVEELLELEKGVKILTHQFPSGRLVRARLGALLGDVVATHKVAGFSSHSAKKPCSWCHVLNTELSSMRLNPLRNTMATLSAARAWRDSNSSERKKLVKRSGVRMSELNRLPYWDPVNNVVLGVMHNWFEGVLQHHFRFRWGLNGTSQTINKELQESEYYTTENDDMDENGISSTFWSDAIKTKLIHAVLEVVVPTGVTQMPRGFGMAKNGKLKASEWHALFSIHLPLASLDIFVGRDIEESLKRNEDIIANLSALVQCTNIVSSKAITSEDCKTFETAYNNYTETSARLFPNLKILPNHHYALHIPQQLRWWGPLMAVSEFPGERLIGLLQKCKTNANTRHIGVTMMNKFCQLQRLKKQQGLDCAHEEKDRIKRGVKFEMDSTAYNEILFFLREENPDLCAHSDLPHPPNSQVLFNYAKSIVSAECPGGKAISRQQPNDMIEYVANGLTCYGQVCEIVELAGAVEEIIVKVVQVTEVERTNGLDKYFQRLNVLHVQLRLPTYVRLKQVVSPVAYRCLPAWSFGVTRPSYLLRPLFGLSENPWPATDDMDLDN